MSVSSESSLESYEYDVYLFWPSQNVSGTSSTDEFIRVLFFPLYLLPDVLIFRQAKIPYGKSIHSLNREAFLSFVEVNRVLILRSFSSITALFHLAALYFQ